MSKHEMMDDKDMDAKGARAPRRKFIAEEVEASIDYKNPQVLRQFVTDRGKMLPRRMTGASARQQRKISLAIRRARILALLPFSVNGD